MSFVIALVVTCSLAPLAWAIEGESVQADGVVTSVSYTRICGNDRYVTMRNLALAAYGGTGTKEAIVVRGDAYDDALAATAYAGLKDAALILTESNSLSREAATALLTLGVEKVTIIGGASDVSSVVETTLEEMYGAENVTRISGTDIYTTFYNVYAAGKGSWGDTAIIATGKDYPDALSISPYANAAGAPIFVTKSDDLLDAASLAAAKTFDKVIIAGGTGVVSASLEEDLKASGCSVVRLGGDNAYDTSVAIAHWLVGDTLAATFQPSVAFTWDGTAFATRFGFADALAGSILQGHSAAPIVLVDSNDSANSVFALIQNTLSSKAIDVCFLGGIGVIPSTTASRITAYWASAINEGEWTFQGDLILPTSVDYTRIFGADRYATMLNLSLAAYGTSGATQAIIVRGDDFKDALAATAYAGLIDAPVILIPSDAFGDETGTALLTLGVDKVTIIGGTGAVSVTNETRIRSLGIDVTRIWGDDCFATAYEVYEAGIGSWGDTAIISTASNFADALSISPYANAAHSPIFLAQSNGLLDAASLAAAKTFDKVIITGGTGVVSTSLDSQLRTAGCAVVRLAGDNAYATSASIAKWIMGLDMSGDFGPGVTFRWDGTAFATRNGFADALAGSILQGRNTSPLLLVDDAAAAESVFNLIDDYVSSENCAIVILGGTGVVPQTTLDRIKNCWVYKTDGGSWSYAGELVRYHAVGTTLYNMTLTAAATYHRDHDLEKIWVNGIFVDATLEQIEYYLDSASFSASDPEYYQFAVLTGYTGLTAAEIDSLLVGRGNLEGMGSAFVNASLTYHINEAYLVAHALLETGYGTSTLAQGFVHTDGLTYYNFYGYGATDSSGLTGGRGAAVKYGWSSPELAISGAAKLISENYLYARGQDTLYEMRWAPAAVVSGNSGYQYASDVAWAAKIGRIMSSVYATSTSSMTLTYDVPIYLSE
ncbi:MAG: hypothetical protein HGA54_03035 [Actinobacteria bacterium]|nr:hypothetical protein [Actinomycetota bacterium]